MTQIIRYTILLFLGLLLQNLLAIKLSPWASYPDVILILLVLILLEKPLSGNWLFVSGFIMGMLQGGVQEQILGLSALFYTLVTFAFSFLILVVPRSFIIGIMLFLISYIIKAILYGFVGVVLRIDSLFMDIFNLEFLYQGLSTIALFLILYILLSIFHFLRKKPSYE